MGEAGIEKAGLLMPENTALVPHPDPYMMHTFRRLDPWNEDMYQLLRWWIRGLIHHGGIRVESRSVDHDGREWFEYTYIFDQGGDVDA